MRFLCAEGVPGEFPYTAGVFPLKRIGEDPKRMFAGEGGPQKTNDRFHFLCRGESANRLSTAFDSVTLYGEDPAHRPDIYGKVGVSGVSVSASRRHEDSVFRIRFVCSEYLGVDDDQRSRPDYLSDVSEHGC